MLVLLKQLMMFVNLQMIVIDSDHHLIDDLIVVRQVLNLMNDVVIVLNLMVHLMNVNLVHVHYSVNKWRKKIQIKKRV